MANWDNPTLTSTYTDVLNELKARDVDALTLQYSAPTNLPTGAIKWNRTDDKFQEWDGAAFVDQVLSIAGGGTGANTASGARTSLGLGTLALQNSNAVNITGGVISGLSSLGISGNLTSTGNGSFSGTLSAVAGGSVPIKSENAVITGNWVFPNLVSLSGVSPVFRFIETDQAVDGKTWDIALNGGVLLLKVMTDALADVRWSLGIPRAGYLIAYQGLQIAGNNLVTGAIASPGQIVYDGSDSITRHYTGDGTGYKWAISKRSGSTTTDLFRVSETGTTVNITGTMAVSGAVSLSANLTVTGDFSCSGSLTLGGNVSVTGTLGVVGILTLSSKLVTPAGSGGSAGTRAIQISSDAGIGMYSPGAGRLVIGTDLDAGVGVIQNYLDLYSTGFTYDCAGTTRLVYNNAAGTFTFSAEIVSRSAYPGTDNTWSCGKSGNRWTAVYAVNGTIQTSDERSKHIKSGFNYGLDFIRNLTPIEYDWISAPTGKTKLGLGARAIHSMYPELDMVNTGMVGSDSELVFGLNYSELIAPIVQAIKDLAVRMDKHGIV